jgi:hypothetical protein
MIAHYKKIPIPTSSKKVQNVVQFFENMLYNSIKNPSEANLRGFK